MKMIQETQIQEFANELYLNEKAKTTVRKYIQAVRQLAAYAKGVELTKLLLLDYREYLRQKNKSQTVNGATVCHQCLSGFLRLAGV